MSSTRDVGPVGLAHHEHLRAAESVAQTGGSARRRTVLLTVCLLAVAACGGDDDDTAATDPPGATVSSPAPSPPGSPASAPAPTVGAGPSSGPPTATDDPAASSPSTPATASTDGTGAPPAVETTSPAVEPTATLTEVASVDTPVDLAWRDGDDGLYVVEQDGRVVRISDEDPTVVLDLSELTGADGERGLLGLAFAPEGDLAYVNYTDGNGDTVIAEHPVDADGTFRTGDEARTVLQIEQPQSNHNGGGLTFGPDGYLYVGMGDGGGAGDPDRTASDPSSLLGKMLRIDPAIADGQPYTVPADNPFVDLDGTAPEIWSSGLRNPWRFSFDRDTGDLWIADVGQSAQEEIDVAPASDGLDAGRGLSFGWSAFEGTDRFNDDVSDAGHLPPIFTYGHGDGDGEGCSISGGVRTRGESIPELAGWYVFTDYCAGDVQALEVLGDGADIGPGRVVTLATDVVTPTAVVDGPDGELYVLSAAGPVLRVDPT